MTLAVFEMQGMEGVMDALTAKRAPIIIGIYSPNAALPNCRALAAYVRCRVEATDVPVSLMLDHGASVELCLQVRAYGFTDVMYDGSKLPLAENIANTKRLVEAAHAAGVSVEAELGHVGMGDQYDSLGGQGIGFTDPESAKHFVRETGVDFLAIAFATSIMNTADNMRMAAAKPEVSMFDIYAGIHAAYSQWCRDLYEVFGVARRV